MEKSLEEHIKDKENRHRIRIEAIKSMTYKILGLDDSFDPYAANEMFMSRIAGLNPAELAEAFHFASDTLNNTCTDYQKTQVSYKLIEKDEDELERRLDSLTVLELAMFIGQINGQIASNFVDKLVICN